MRLAIVLFELALLGLATITSGLAADPPRVVFLGDSITQNWPTTDPAFFRGRPWIARGVSGQTTDEIRQRFQRDVLDLAPAVVVILAGTNDIAENVHPYQPDSTRANIAAMCARAREHGVRVILASVLPTRDYPWHTGLEPASKIVALNKELAVLAAREGYLYLDYYSAMADPNGALRRELGDDGVHPNEAGYAIMEKLVEAAITKALGSLSPPAARS